MEKSERQTVFEIVRRAYDGGRVLDPRELQLLLCYLAPPAPRIAKTPEEWVAKACGQAARPHELWKELLLVHQGVAYASDGLRAHRARTELRNGYYCPRALVVVPPPASPSPIPNVLDSLFPCTTGQEALATPSQGTIASAPFENATGAGVLGREWQGVVVRLLGMTFNRKFLLQACNGDVSVPLRVGKRQANGASCFGDFAIAAL